MSNRIKILEKVIMVDNKDISIRCHIDVWTYTAVLFNPYKPSVPSLGHRQTVQTQIRRRRIKMKKYTRHPQNWKWTRPIDKDGLVH